MDTSKTVTASFVACVCAADVSNSVVVTRRDAPDCPITQEIHMVTLTNISAATIKGPVSLVPRQPHCERDVIERRAACTPS